MIKISQYMGSFSVRCQGFLSLLSFRVKRRERRSPGNEVAALLAFFDIGSGGEELLLANKIPEFTSVRQGFLSLPKIADLNIGEKKRWDRGWVCMVHKIVF